MNEIADRYRRRAGDFERKIEAVRPEQWELQSPCAKWTARDVVSHIIDMHGAMLRPFESGLSPAPSVADDPLGAYRSARADVQAVLDDPELAATEAPTPAGAMPVERHIDQVISDDLVLHGWDLARATGQDDTFDPTDLDRLWAVWQTMPAELLTRLRTPGAFGPDVEVLGPEVKVPGDASRQEQLLGVLGRDPNWTA